MSAPASERRVYTPFSFLMHEVAPAVAASRLSVVLALCLMALTTAGSVLSLEVSRAAIQVLDGSGQAADRSIVLQLLAAHGFVARGAAFSACAVLAVSLATLTALALYGQYLVFERIAIDVVKRLRVRIFVSMIGLPYGVFQQHQPGYFIKRMSEDTRELRGLIMEAGLMRLADVVFVLGLVVYMASLSFTLTMTSIFCLLIYLGGAWWSAKLARGRLRQADAAFETVIHQVERGAALFHDIRANRRERTETARFSAAIDRHAVAMFGAVRFLLADRSITGFLSALGPIVVLAVGGFLVIRGAASLENIIAFVAIVSVLYKPVNALSAVPLILTRSGIAVENIGQVIEEPSETVVRGSPRPAPAPVAEPVAEPSAAAITGLRFSYPGSGQRLAIDRLVIAPGERVCLVGPSGCGKSTLFRILFGLLPVFEGEVAVGGMPVASQALPELRGKVAYMTQETRLLGASVTDNVLYGLGDDPVDDPATVADALALAGLSAEVAAMPAGAATLVGPGGQDLSGGQQRRIVLARALIGKPTLVLLDEPLNGVAARDRQDILRALGDRDRTPAILMSTHQEDLLALVDRVVMLGIEEQGGIRTTRVVAEGSHAWLLGNVEEYRHHIGEPG